MDPDHLVPFWKTIVCCGKIPSRFFLLKGAAKKHPIFWIWLSKEQLPQNCPNLSWRIVICPKTNLPYSTPQKTKMEPEAHPFEKKNHLPNLHFWVPYSIERVYHSTRHLWEDSHTSLGSLAFALAGRSTTGGFRVLNRSFSRSKFTKYHSTTNVLLVKYTLED